MVTFLLLMQNRTTAQDITDDECFDVEFGCDVEGVSSILASTDSSEIDTFSATFISFDLLDNAFEADVVATLFLDDLETEVDSQEGFDDGSGEADAFMSDAVELGHAYGLGSDHYLFDDFSGEFTFIGSSFVAVDAGAPDITSINPVSAQVGTSGQLVVNGFALFDQFDFSVGVSNIPGVTFSANSFNPDGTEIVLNYAIATNASTGDQNFFLETRFGRSNTLIFRIDDPTPVVTSVTPSQWDAGTQTSITVVGRFFGTCPTLDISGPGVTGSSVSSFSDTQIQGTVTIDPASAGGTATVNVTSDGYTCSGFVGNPGQPSKGSNTAQVRPKPAPAPQITYFGTPLTGTQTVTVGQRIELSSTATTVAPLAVSSYSWSAPSPGATIASFTGSLAAGEQPSQLLSFSNPSLTFYWVSTGGGASASNSLTFTYCMVNNQCSAPVTGTFTVNGPDPSAKPTITPTSVSIFRLTNGTDNLAFQTVAVPPQDGIRFVAPGSASLPSGNQGQYQWVQLINSEQNIFMNSGGIGTCSGFTGPAGVDEIDQFYPYGALGTVTTTGGITNDTATDSPHTTIKSSIGEWQRSFSATMYLRWKPNQDNPACTAGDACIIPVPLGSASWRYSGCAINAKTPQNSNFTHTNLIKSCPQDPQTPQTVVFQSSAPGPGNSFGYKQWTNSVSSAACDTIQ
jgi:hypothetical protein